MKDFGQFWRDMFEGRGREPEPDLGRSRVPPGGPWPSTTADSLPGVRYKKGDVIGGRYEVHGILGMGGFGLVYLVYCRETKSVYALKTYRDELVPVDTRRVEDEATWNRFRREAQVWVNLDRHPYVVRAHFVDMIKEESIFSREYLAMDYIAPGEQGLNSLEGYLRHCPPDLVQSLRWAIQVCYGMEYAYSKGIRSHRDIKPANILISQDRSVKISDFGLAGVLGKAWATSGVPVGIQRVMEGLYAKEVMGTGFGTPTHMPPEQFTNAAGCDERSDIYSFGVVLYQMATGGELPFLAPPPKDGSQEEMWRFWWRLHSECPVPRADSLLFPIIQRCLEKAPGRRYESFTELRSHLEPILRHHTGETIKVPAFKELETEELLNKTTTFFSLGSYMEALGCCERALELDPQNARAWIEKARCLKTLGRAEEAIPCYDRVLKLSPEYWEMWLEKAHTFERLDRFDEAIRCYDRYLEANPRETGALYYKGEALQRLDRFDEAIRCYDRYLEANPRETGALYYKGEALQRLGQFGEAIECYDRILELEPEGRRHAASWRGKATCLRRIGRFEEAIRWHERILGLGRGEGFFGKDRLADAWYCKALCEEQLGRKEDARLSYREFMIFAPGAWRNALAQQIEYARRRLREMEDS